MSCCESNRNDAIALVCYGIFSEGKWYPFDAKGNELAKALIEKTKKSDHIKAPVEGMKHQGKILVEKMAGEQ